MEKDKKKKDKEQPSTHKDLEGFEIKINEFGEVTSSLPVDAINAFLNENVEDKKLSSRIESKDEEE